MMVETTMSSSSPPFPTSKDIPGTVHHVCQDRSSLWFCPAIFQSALDILMDKLDQVSSNLANLLVSLLEDGADPPSAW